jgi:hypothetical protein
VPPQLARLGGDPKAFFASGNRVAGAAGAGAASAASVSNTAVSARVALADVWDGKSDLTGWAIDWT